VHVAQSASATPSHKYALTMLGNISEDCVMRCISDNRTNWYTNDQISPFSTMAAIRTTITTTCCAELTLMKEAFECIQICVSLKVDGTTTASITTVRTAKPNETFPPEVHTTVTTVTCLNDDFYVIYKHRAYLHYKKTYYI
jgi:hypothetical protein